MAIRNQEAKTERDRRKAEILFTKLQQNFKKSGRHTDPVMEARMKQGLSELVLMMETPHLVDPSFRTQQQRRFSAAIRKNVQQPSAESANLGEEESDRAVLDIHSNKVVVFDDMEADCNRRVEQSAAEFNYIGSESEYWNQWSFNTDDLDLIETTGVVFPDKFSIQITGDKKYSRDEIFNLSSPKQVSLAFS